MRDLLVPPHVRGTLREPVFHPLPMPRRDRAVRIGLATSALMARLAILVGPAVFLGYASSAAAALVGGVLGLALLVLTTLPPARVPGAALARGVRALEGELTAGTALTAEDATARLEDFLRDLAILLAADREDPVALEIGTTLSVTLACPAIGGAVTLAVIAGSGQTARAIDLTAQPRRRLVRRHFLAEGLAPRSWSALLHPGYPDRRLLDFALAFPGSVAAAQISVAPPAAHRRFSVLRAAGLTGAATSH